MISQREGSYQKIRGAILRGDLKPGERLIEKRLSEMFKIGRTPLREALNQLKIEGFVEFSPNKGASVTKGSVENVEQIYNILAVLEGYATEMATPHLNAKDIKRLRFLQNNQKKARASNDFNKWLDNNALFHTYFAKASDNIFLHTIIDNLRNRVYWYRIFAVTIPGYAEVYFIAHDEILEAISKKEAKRAGKLMRKHVLDVARKLVLFLKRHPNV